MRHRAITVGRLLAKTYKVFEFNGVWQQIFGRPEKGGIWLIFGAEKNGKTTMAVLMAAMFAKWVRVDYISAEEGTGAEFQETVKRAGLDAQDRRLRFLPYISLQEMMNRLEMRQSASVVFIDNITIYRDELGGGMLRKLTALYPKVTFVFLAHAERNEPYTATAVLCKKLAKVIVRIEGLTAFVSGRCPGGNITIDNDKAMLYHGIEPLNQNQ